MAVLADLPHWKSIAHRFTAWAEAVEKEHGGHNLVAFARQVCSFDATEFAFLAKELNGLPFHGDRARTICSQKLLLTPPAVRQVTEWKPGAKENAFNRLEAAVDVGLEQQIRGSVGEGFRFGAGALGRLRTGQLVLITPSSEDTEGEMSYDEAMRLHVDAHIAARAGHHPHALIAVRENGGVVSSAVRLEFLSEIERVHRAYWQTCVSQNCLPIALPAAPGIEPEPLLAMADKAALLKLIGDAAYAEFKTIEPGLRAAIAATDFMRGSLTLRALTVESRSEGELRFLVSRSPQVSALREQLRTDVVQLLDNRLASVSGITDLAESKLVPATEIVRKPARKPASF